MNWPKGSCVWDASTGLTPGVVRDRAGNQRKKNRKTRNAVPRSLCVHKKFRRSERDTTWRQETFALTSVCQLRTVFCGTFLPLSLSNTSANRILVCCAHASLDPFVVVLSKEAEVVGPTRAHQQTHTITNGEKSCRKTARWSSCIDLMKPNVCV